jgi:hypothetical protein
VPNGKFTTPISLLAGVYQGKLDHVMHITTCRNQQQQQQQHKKRKDPFAKDNVYYEQNRSTFYTKDYTAPVLACFLACASFCRTD